MTKQQAEAITDLIERITIATIRNQESSDVFYAVNLTNVKDEAAKELQEIFGKHPLFPQV